VEEGTFVKYDANEVGAVQIKIFVTRGGRLLIWGP
jgi:hypothetical protein